MAKSNSSNSFAGSTQKYLDIAEIRDNVLIMKNGSMRAVLMVSSMNFALKSIDEQDAIIYRYQNFLNSLDFSVQIVIHSRKLNIDSYLDVLREEEKKQTNDLLRIQMASYAEFVVGLIEEANIVTKTFYIVVPFAVIESKNDNFISRFTSASQASVSLSNRTTFKKYRDQLFQRVDHVVENLSGTGLRMTLLKTQELIELFYGIYNPETLDRRGLASMDDIDLAQ